MSTFKSQLQEQDEPGLNKHLWAAVSTNTGQCKLNLPLQKTSCSRGEMTPKSQEWKRFTPTAASHSPPFKLFLLFCPPPVCRKLTLELYKKKKTTHTHTQGCQDKPPHPPCGECHHGNRAASPTIISATAVCDPRGATRTHTHTRTHTMHALCVCVCVCDFTT